MREKKNMFLSMMIAASILFTISCTTPVDEGNDDGVTTPTPITFESAVQTGGTSGTADSTGLTLTFSLDPTTLAASDITVTGATKGALTGNGTTRSLAISNITVANGETVSVAIANPSRFTISGSPKTAVVYKDTLTPVSYRDLVSITGGTYTQTDGTNSFSHTISDFSLGQYEVTYELWYTVYQWAISNGYTFANAGNEGNDGTAGAAPSTAPTKYEPVTTINWRDAIVWCNAYSEMSGLTPVYCTDAGFNTYLKTSTNTGTVNTTAGSEDNPYVNWSANGYRLPTEGEWQYVASNKGATPWNYASGATADYNNATATGLVAWYSSNSGSSTNPVGTTTNPSALTLRDMSGNVWEWCWDRRDDYPGASTNYRGSASGSYRIIRGGCWSLNAGDLRLGFRRSDYPYSESYRIGFRVARTN